MRNISLIVIHCSASPQGQHVTVYDIDRWHAERGFKRQEAAAAAFNPALKHIGYHFVVDLKGDVFTGRGLDEIGAHVAGSNANSIGICMVGMNKFTPAQWAALRKLVIDLHAAYPNARICGHRDLSPDLNGDGQITRNEWLKDCPTFDVKTWLLAGMQPLAANTVRE